MVTSADGRANIEFPAQTTVQTLTVEITHRASSDFPPVPGHQIVNAWQFDAYAPDMTKVTQFSGNVHVITNYTLEDLYGLNPESLRLWTWDEQTAQWDEVVSTHVPYTGNVVASASHFSVYASTADPFVHQAPFRDAFQADLHSGASQINLPIDLPPGRGGLVPQLSLTYSSNSVNEMKDPLSQGSWTGIGWDLSVGSVRKAFLPGGGTRYFLELNGAGDELLQDGGVWRTRHHDYLRIQQVGSCGLVPTGTGGDSNPTPPCHWVVTDKQGRKYYFGGTGDTVQDHDSNSTRYYDLYWSNPSGFQLFYYQWDLKRVTDLHSNEVNYTYIPQPLSDCPGIPGGGCHCCQPWVFSSYPAQISYNGGRVLVNFVLGANQQGQDPIDLNHFPSTIQLRPDSPRNLASNEPAGCTQELQQIGGTGIKVEETRSLRTIEVKAADISQSAQLVRSYALDYETTPFARTAPACIATAGEHRLKTLSQKGNDGASLYTMQFDYTPNSTQRWINDGTEHPDSSPSSTFNRPFLTNASNGFGGSTSYYYSLEPRMSPLASGQTSWSRRLVSQRVLYPHTGTVPSIVTRYSYSNGPAYSIPMKSDGVTPDYQNEEYRGFGLVSEIFGSTDPSPHTDHTYYTTGTGLGWDDEVRTGHESMTQAYGADGTRWQETDYDWHVNGLGNCSSYNPNVFCNSNFVSLNSVTVKDGRPGNVTTINTAYDYDSHGNTVVERDNGDTTVTGDERTIYHPYHDAEGPWLFLPQFEHVYQGAYSESDLLPTLGQIPTSAQCSDPANWLYTTPACKRKSETTYFYDGSNRYDTLPTKGELTGVHHWYGTTNVYYKYDDVGNLIKQSLPTTIAITGPQGSADIPAGVKFTQWGYDPPGTPKQRTFPQSVTDAENHPPTSLVWNERMGTLSERDEPNGNWVSFAYDNFGRLKTVQDSLSQGVWTTQYVYDWTGSTNGTGLNKTLTEHRFGTGSTDFTWKSACYDGLGREAQVRKSYVGTSPSTGPDSVVETSYDDRGWVKYHSEPFTANDQLTACTAPETVGIPATFYSYDPLGNPTFITNPDNSVRIVDRNGLKTAVADENLHKVEQLHDAYGHLIQVAEYTGNGSQSQPYGSYAITKYGYDVLGNLTTITDAANNALQSPVYQTQMAFDQLGRQTDLYDPDLGNTPSAHLHYDYSYDATGVLSVTKTDARGALSGQVSMLYDGLDRMVRKCYGVPATNCTSGSSSVAATYTYDSYDSGICNTSSATAIGHLTKMEDPSGQAGTARWCYDERGRTTQEQRIIDGVTYGVSRTYDVADRVQTVTYPNPDSSFEQLTNCYDPVSGQPTALATSSTGSTSCTPPPSGSTYVQNTTYDVAYRPTAIPLGTSNTQTTNYTYDVRGRTSRITTGSVQDVNYVYDPASNVKSMADNVKQEALTYCYDDLNRLTTMTVGSTCGSPNYAYDQIGNLTHVNEGTSNWYLNYSSSIQPHAVQSATVSPNGSDTYLTYAYDSSGNLRTVTDSGRATTGDGCSDAQKVQSGAGSEKAGGRRDPTNFWDYADNPDNQNLRDKQIRITDVTRVISRYRTNDANGTALVNRNTDPMSTPPATGYHPAYDHGTALGPYNWNRGAPDGKIDITDVVAVIDQYRHDCAVTTTNFINNTYDAEGRLLTSTSRAAGLSTVTTNYVYDGQGTVVKKTAGSSLPTVYIGGIYEKQGSSVTKYYWFDGRRVALRQAGTLFFLVADALGSSSQQLDASGQVVVDSGSPVPHSESYFPFGKTRNYALVGTDKEFAGQQRDGELYHMGARFYDPQIGRFIQPDSIIPDLANPQSLNRYSYVYNNPLRYTDPTGHCPFCDDIISGAEHIGGAIEHGAISAYNGFTDAIGGWTGNGWSGVGGVVGWTWYTTQEAASSAAQTAQDVIRSAPGAITDAASSARDALESGASAIARGTGDATSAVAETARNVTETIVSTAQAAIVNCMNSSSCTTYVAGAMILGGAATGQVWLTGAGIGIMTASDASRCFGGSNLACGFLVVDAVSVGSMGLQARGIRTLATIPRTTTPTEYMIQAPTAIVANGTFRLAASPSVSALEAGTSMGLDALRDLWNLD